MQVKLKPSSQREQHLQNNLAHSFASEAWTKRGPWNIPISHFKKSLVLEVKYEVFKNNRNNILNDNVFSKFKEKKSVQSSAVFNTYCNCTALQELGLQLHCTAGVQTATALHCNNLTRTALHCTAVRTALQTAQCSPDCARLWCLCMSLCSHQLWNK